MLALRNSKTRAVAERPLPCTVRSATCERRCRAIPAWAIVSVAAFGAGCLGELHQIPTTELSQLAMLEPGQRGEHVRVIQDFGGSRDVADPDYRVRSHDTVVVHDPIWINGTPHRCSRRVRGCAAGTVSGSGSGTGWGGGAQVSGGSPVDHGSVRGSAAKPTGGAHPSAPGRGAANALADAKIDDAVALIAVAAGAMAILAVTEGQRTDGWVRVHPMHPVHLYGPDGQYTQLPLAHLDAETAAWARRAYIRKADGPVWDVQRGPLNRVGWNYTVTLGSGEIPMEGEGAPRGFFSHIQLGHSLSQRMGIAVDLGLGWARDPLGAAVFEARYAVEAQIFPVKAGALHLGLFGQLGLSDRYDDGLQVDDVSAFSGAGTILQLELASRLALTGRLGMTRTHGELATEITAGLTVY